MVGWFQENSEEHSKPVGQKEPNVWGLYDMSGNVWEWCWDWKGPTTIEAMDPIGPPEGLGRIFGGIISKRSNYMRVSHRGFERLGIICQIWVSDWKIRK